MSIPIRGVSHGSPGAAFETAKRRGAQRLDFLLEYAKCLWSDAAQVGVRADLLFAQADLETGSFTSRYWTEDGNPAGIAAFDDGSDWGLTFTPQKAARGQVVHMLCYLGIEPPEGWKAADARWDAAVKAGYFGSVETVDDLGNGRWATDPRYAEKVESRHAAYNFAPPSSPSSHTPTEDTDMGFKIGDRPVRIAVGVGHANASGGNAYELRKNKEVMAAFLALARSSTGFDVRCYTPNDGQGNSPLTLDGVVYATVHQWVKAGWIPDIIFEIHHEGLGATSVRGGFFIYPNSVGLNGRKASGGDFVDVDVRTHGPAMARIVTQKIGVPLRYGTGIMSETQTGVATGPGRWRLGYFGALSDPVFQENCCVFISEAATYTNPQDLAIMNSAGFAQKEALGLLEACAYLAKQAGSWTYAYKIGTAPAPKPDPKPVPAFPPPLVIPELDRYKDAPMPMPGFIDFTFEGVKYRAFPSFDRVRTTQAQKRLRRPDGSEAEVVGEWLKPGEEFDLDFSIIRLDNAAGYAPMGRTPWGTFVWLQNIERTSDEQAA